MVDKRHIKLYGKVFLILFGAGVLLPYVINSFFGGIFPMGEKAPGRNALFVMYNNDCQATFFKTFFKILAKFLGI